MPSFWIFDSIPGLLFGQLSLLSAAPLQALLIQVVKIIAGVTWTLIQKDGAVLAKKLHISREQTFPIHPKIYD